MADRKLSASTELAVEPDTSDLFAVLDVSDTTDAATGTLKKILWNTLNVLHVRHSLATAANDFLVASGAGVFVKKTLAETLTILGKGAASGLAALDANSKVDASVSDSSDVAKGKVELATIAETTAGTDATRAVTPDGFAGSDYGKRLIQVKVMDDATVLTTGEGKLIFCIPSEFNGFNLVAAQAFVSTVSSSGLPSIGIRNVTDSVEMLSTNVTIDASEYTSYTAATVPVIDAAHDDVATGDLIAIDVDGAGTGAKGLGVILSFQLP